MSKHLQCMKPTGKIPPASLEVERMEMAALTASPTKRSTADVFELFTARLARTGTSYCIVGDVSAFPDHIHSDVDLVFFGDESEAELLDLVAKFCADNGLQLAQILRHEACAYYACIFWETPDGWASIKLDWCTDYVRNGRLIVKRSEFRGHTRKQFYGNDGHYFWVPTADIGFLYYLAKRLDKRILTPENAIYLKSLWDEDAVLAEQGFLSVWRADDIAELRGLLDDPKGSASADTAERLLQRLHQQRPRQLGQTARDLLRRAGRFLRPTGLVTAVLGPDGVGKSTVIDGIIEQLESGFRRTQYLHLRPGLGMKRDGKGPANTDPHGLAPYGNMLSLAKLGYLVCDYVAGYLIKIRPAKVRSTLIVFDRYYHDLIVDPRRYRYGGPSRWLRFFAGILPSPDLMLVLDAPAEVILERKAEVAPEECRRQVAAYRELPEHYPFVTLIDAAAPADEVVRSASRALIAAMTMRTARRLGRH